MTFKILNQYGLINGVTNSSLGLVNQEKIIKFLRQLGSQGINKKNLVFAEQIHKAGVHLCKKDDGGSIQKGIDALVTNHPNQVLVVKTADCIPILISSASEKKGSRVKRGVLIYDPLKKVVAAIHAGRKSLTQKIIQKTIAKMEKNYGIMPKNLKVAIGPHIRKCHYFLKPGALENLKNTKWKKYFIERDRIYFDMTAATLDELLESGILRENIEDCGICTYCNYQKYYSARKKEENPKVYKEKFPSFASIIGMK